MDDVVVDVKPGTYPNIDDIIVDDDGPSILLPCIICNKTFKPEALERHSRFCEKNASKKRKTFDSFKQRVQGTDLAEFLPFTTLQKRLSGSEKLPSPHKSANHWKEKHEAFVSAIRAARGTGNGDNYGRSSGSESRSLLRPPEHEKCPYCDRHFGPKAFDRHQDWCREQRSRQPPTTASQQAKQRLEARIKYRAPPIKSKRALTREKYSPLAQRKVRQSSPSDNSISSHSGNASASSNTTRQRIQTSLAHQRELSNRLSKSSNTPGNQFHDKDGGTHVLNRSFPGRSSLRASQRTSQKPGSPSKNISSGRLITSSYALTSKQSMANEDPLSSSYNVKRLQLAGRSDKQNQLRNQEKKFGEKQISSQSTKTKPLNVEPKSIYQKEEKENMLNNNNNSNNNIQNKKSDQMWRSSKSEEPYDPYASAERQMMELLHSDSANNIPAVPKNKSPSPDLPPSPPLSAVHSPKPSSLETSPTSAFMRYSKEAEVELSQTESEITIKDDSESEASSKGQQPQPPPRAFKRSASLQVSSESNAATRPQLLLSRSVDEATENNNNNNFESEEKYDNRPRTYDVDRGSRDGSKGKQGWVDSETTEDIDKPVLRNNADGGKSEILTLEDINNGRKSRRETRESREVREITEKDKEMSAIDGLLEEVVQMQRSVSLLSASVPSDPLPQPVISSARSRRNRAGKMHIEDYLFPAEFLGKNDIIFNELDPVERSSSVFGSTKSRRSRVSSKGRRLIEDMVFPPEEVDVNANEDGDVVVSANALIEASRQKASPPPSPVALTSKMIDADNGLPRPKPLMSPLSPRRTKDEEFQSSASSPLQRSSRFSADSAYSSLNRRSPIPQLRRQATVPGQRDVPLQYNYGTDSPQSVVSQSIGQSLVLSSSSSESSLPPLSNAQTARRGSRGKTDRDTPNSEMMSATTPLLPKLSKFCHECGTKFPVSMAKFCHECGAKRLELC